MLQLEWRPYLMQSASEWCVPQGLPKSPEQLPSHEISSSQGLSRKASMKEGPSNQGSENYILKEITAPGSEGPRWPRSLCFLGYCNKVPWIRNWHCRNQQANATIHIRDPEQLKQSWKRRRERIVTSSSQLSTKPQSSRWWVAGTGERQWSGTPLRVQE